MVNRVVKELLLIIQKNHFTNIQNSISTMVKSYYYQTRDIISKQWQRTMGGINIFYQHRLEYYHQPSRLFLTKLSDLWRIIATGWMEEDRRHKKEGSTPYNRSNE
jgi:hypothetical protein